MAIEIKHAKTNNIADWTQAQLDSIIAGNAPPLPPAGTVLNDIVLPSDWNANLNTSIATNKLVGRTTAGTGSFEEIGADTTLSLSSNTLGVNTAHDFVSGTQWTGQHWFNSSFGYGLAINITSATNWETGAVQIIETGYSDFNGTLQFYWDPFAVTGGAFRFAGNTSGDKNILANIYYGTEVSTTNDITSYSQVDYLNGGGNDLWLIKSGNSTSGSGNGALGLFWDSNTNTLKLCSESFNEYTFRSSVIDCGSLYTASITNSAGDLNLASAGGNTLNGGNFKLNTAGNGFYIKEGSNACMGVTTLVAGTKTVNTNKVTANSRIFLTVQSLGTVTAPKAIAVTARVNGTSFTITSADATDTSVVAWEIKEPA